jgi:hypothetical protein
MRKAPTRLRAYLAATCLAAICLAVLVLAGRALATPTVRLSARPTLHVGSAYRTHGHAVYSGRER